MLNIGNPDSVWSFFVLGKMPKIEPIKVIIIKFGRKVTSYQINTMNVPKIGIFSLADFRVIFVLGKMPKIEPINIFSPSFHQRFSMIILSNIFENEVFRLKMAEICHFFRKNSFLGGYLGALS